MCIFSEGNDVVASDASIDGDSNDDLLGIANINISRDDTEPIANAESNVQNVPVECNLSYFALLFLFSVLMILHSIDILFSSILRFRLEVDITPQAFSKIFTVY